MSSNDFWRFMYFNEVMKKNSSRNNRGGGSGKNCLAQVLAVSGMIGLLYSIACLLSGEFSEAAMALIIGAVLLIVGLLLVSS